MFVAQFFYAAILYSVYLALHGWLIWVYILIVGLNGVHGILGILAQTGLGFLFYAMVIAYYFMAARKLFYDSLPFREGKPGGDVTGRVIGSVSKNIATGVKQQLANRNGAVEQRDSAFQRGMPPREESKDDERGSYPVGMPQLTAAQMIQGAKLMNKASQLAAPLLKDINQNQRGTHN